MKNNQTTPEIDLVYLWVDGNDPAWQAKRQSVTGCTFDNKSPVDCKGRYVENQELKYSLRSIQMYAPWVRRIFIVTDRQTPEWLDTSNPKVRVVDHTEIMPPESLPCFNASVIEHYLWRIPGLAEHFIFANDDMMLNREATPDDFFTSNGFPIVRLTRKPFSKLRMAYKLLTGKKIKNYTGMIYRSAKMVEKLYGTYIGGMPHHNIDAYLKSDCQRIAEKKLNAEFQSNATNHIRNDNDVHRSIFSFISIAEKRAVLRWVNERESFYCKIHKSHHYERLRKMNPIFFCMNDSEYCSDSDRVRMKEYLDERFPEKSTFEK